MIVSRREQTEEEKESGEVKTEKVSFEKHKNEI